MNYSTTIHRLGLCISSIMVGAGIVFAQGNPLLDSDTVVFTSSNLPIIMIDTHGDSIPDEPKITADMKIIYNGDGIRNAITDMVYHYNGKIGIEVRGESSQQFPKLQYGFETRNTSGEGIDVALLGFPADNDWIIAAVYNDKTLMRDFLAYYFTRGMGRYATRARYCELVLNGRYWGVYLLFEKIKRGKYRANISKIDSSCTSGDDLTGGYIIRMDKTDPGDRWWASSYPPVPGSRNKIRYQYYYPKPDKILPQQETYIHWFMNSFESMMDGAGYADTATGYPGHLDVGSAVDYFIMNELTKNVDAYRLSAYLHKDKDSEGDRLVIGPVWDFTCGWGNSRFYDGGLTDGWQMTYLTTNEMFLAQDPYQVPFWWKKLFNDPGFMEVVKNRWIELRQNQLSLERIYGCIDSVAAHIDEAQKRNFIKWPILGVNIMPNFYVDSSYSGEVAFIKKWINERVHWMDIELTGSSLGMQNEHHDLPAQFMLCQNYPNPVNPSTIITFRIPISAYVTLKIFDVMGREIATPISRIFPAGTYFHRWDAGSLPSGVYFYSLEAGEFHQVKKLILVK